VNTVLQVLDGEQQVNAIELELDEQIRNVIVRRQPAARDLRLLMAALEVQLQTRPLRAAERALRPPS
jgi:phosphate uptake regulator